MHSICIRSIKSVKKFKKLIFDFIGPKENSVYPTNDISSLKLLTHLRLSFSHLNEHKFRLNFKNSINAICPCNFEPETTDFQQTIF